jgi:hypothetical protein
VDIINAQTGQLAERVLLSEQILTGGSTVSQIASEVMSITPTGNEIFLLTTSGLTVVQLDSVPLAVGKVTGTLGSTAGTLTIRGSGFVDDTSVKLNGVAVSSSLVDSSTLKIIIPEGLRNGPAQLKLSNPDGSKIVMDDATVVR